MGAAAASHGVENRVHMKPEVLAEWDLMSRLSATDVATMYASKTQLFTQMRDFLDRYDFYVLPVTQVSPFAAEIDWPRSVNGTACHTYIDWMRSCWFISATEHPALSVPCGFTSAGLPIGMQIVAAHRSEMSLLQFGHAYEGATNHWQRHPPL